MPNAIRRCTRIISGRLLRQRLGCISRRNYLTALRQRGVEVAFLTLHVGAGTFQPVRTEQVESHVMEEEEYEIPEDVAQRINAAKHEGRKIIAVGTTNNQSLGVGME